MNQPYFCRECGLFDEQGISGHATNRCKPATNEVVTRATNQKIERPEAVREVGPASDQGNGLGKTANRRSREAYNAYQREYMRKRRA